MRGKFHGNATIGGAAVREMSGCTPRTHPLAFQRND